MLQKLARSQTGFAPIIVVLILLLGVGASTVLVQRGTRFIPFADCNPGIDNDCDTGGGSEDDPEEQAARQKEEQADLEKGAAEAGKSVDEYKVDDCKVNPGKSGCDEILRKDAAKKSGGSTEDGSTGDSTKKDCKPVTYCEDGTEVEKRCFDDGTAQFKKLPYKNPEEGGRCVNNKAENLPDGTVVGEPTGGNLGKNPNTSSSQSTTNSSQSCDNFTWCGPNGNRIHKITLVDPKTGECGESKQEDTGELCNKDGKQYRAGDIIATAGEDLVLKQKIQTEARAQAAEANKADLDNLRKQLDPDPNNPYFSADKDYISNYLNCTRRYGENFDCAQKVQTLTGISNAQSEYDKLKTNPPCTTTDEPCQATLSAAYTKAQLLYRGTACDAVAANVKGSNCKPDMGDTQNLIRVNIDGADRRIFIGCSSSRQTVNGQCQKVLNYRADDGTLKELDDSAKEKLCQLPNGTRSTAKMCQDVKSPIYDLNDLPDSFKSSSELPCKIQGSGCVFNSVSTNQPIATTSTTVTTGSKLADEIALKLRNDAKKENPNDPKGAGIAAGQKILANGGNAEQAAGAASDVIKEMNGSVDDQVFASMAIMNQATGNRDPNKVAQAGLSTALSRTGDCTKAVQLARDKGGNFTANVDYSSLTDSSGKKLCPNASSTNTQSKGVVRQVCDNNKYRCSSDKYCSNQGFCEPLEKQKEACKDGKTETLCPLNRECGSNKTCVPKI